MSNEPLWSQDPVWFREAFAAQFKARRQAEGFSQDQVAAAARDIGLDWSRSTVAAIEAGQRSVPFEELVFLPLLWGRLDGDMRAIVELGELLPQQGRIRLTEHASISADALRATVEGRLSDPARRPLDDFDTPTHTPLALRLPEHSRPLTEGEQQEASGEAAGQQRVSGQSSGRRIEVELTDTASVTDQLAVASSDYYKRLTAYWPELTPEMLEEIERAAAGEAERKAAAKLGITPFQVSLAAFYRHRQSLTSARDRYVNARMLGRPAFVGQEQMVREGTEILPRSLQAMRGHATRVLLDGIADTLRLEPWIKEM